DARPADLRDRRPSPLPAARPRRGRGTDLEGLLSGVPARPERDGRGRVPAGYRGLMDVDRVAEALAGAPAYRTRQVWEWAARGASSYAEMTNVPARERALLEEQVP